MSRNETEQWESLPFEEAMEKLESVVEQLESGDVPLEKAIQLFEQGMKLSQICGAKLERLEQQVEILVQENGDWVKKPFQTEEEPE